MVGSAAQGEVTDSSAAGFTVKFEVTIEASPAEVYSNLVNEIDDWWHPDHTYSGDSANLYLEAQAKGWLGERLPNGGVVQHMEVLYAAPSKVLRLRGALGPLQEFALVGTMSWVLMPADDKTKLKLVYYVGGYRPGGVADFAKPVNAVIGMQADRLKCFCETGSAMPK
jgi:uncharacterized protein YndB with AHSA1/START domain